MLDMFLSGNAAWFGVPALVGTAVFAIRLALMLIGGHGGLDVDTGHGDVGLGGHDAGHHDSSDSLFKIISFQSIMAFTMGFGWGGLGALRGANLGMVPSFLAAVGGGLLMVWVLTLLLKGIMSLTTSGNVSIRDAAGREGQVYAEVPPSGGGRGQVSVVIDDRQRIYNAVSAGDGIPSQSRVKVVKVNEDNTLTVVPV